MADTPPEPSTQDILQSDAAPAPALMMPSGVDSLGLEDWPADVYLSDAQHQLELQRVWSRCWQMVGREDQLTQPGDTLVYDIGDDSVIVLRDESHQLRAFINSCPHRGTRLMDGGARLQQIRCPFHGFTWNLAGELSKLPCAWDFPQVDQSKLGLDAVNVDCWGGFVFINLARNPPALAEYLECLPEHFNGWAMQQRFTAAHVVKHLNCNWKIAIEAFIETFHVIGVHPQSLPFFGDTNSQFDVWEGVRHVSRMVNPSGVASPHIAKHSSPQRVVDAAASFGLCSPGPLQPEETPRLRIASALRARFADMGVDLSAFSDSEVMDVIQYYVFPNLIVFGGFGSPLVYRVRPAGHDPQRCVFEVWLLLPHADTAPPPTATPTRWLADDEPFAAVPELSYFGAILDQDAELMPRVQRGLRSSRKRAITLSRYQEIRLRHMRQTLAGYLKDTEL